MLKRHLSFALRHLARHKVLSAINIAGLAVGMASTILILLWVQDELRFDTFNEEAGSVYRVVVNTPTVRAPMTPGPLAPAASEEIPEVANAARVGKAPSFTFRVGPKTFSESNGFIADPSLASVLTFRSLRGDLRQGLSAPFSVVLTQNMAQRCFGSEDPVNKAIQLIGGGTLTVTGVIADPPRNSHLQFDYVMSYSTLKVIGLDTENWGDFGFQTYLKLRPGASPDGVADKLNQLYDRKTKGAGDIRFSLQRLLDIHLTGGLQYDPAVLGNVKYVYAFSFAAVLILMIACMNFINLATSRSTMRYREVGVRKALGARRRALIAQFFLESFIVIVAAVALSLVLVESALPAFNQLAGKQLDINFFDPQLLAGLLGIALLTALLSETYPALSLAGLSPVRGLRANPRSGEGRGRALRTTLAVLQFALSIGLMIATAVISEQVSFMRNAGLGFTKEGLVYVPTPSRNGDAGGLFKDGLMQCASVASVSFAEYLPTEDTPAMAVDDQGVQQGRNDWEGRTGSSAFKLEINAVGYDFVRTMGMELLGGREFSAGVASDAREAYILNEEAVTQMHLASPVGKWLKLNGQKGTIVGVVRNAHFKSLQHRVAPQLFTLLTRDKLAADHLFGVTLIRLRGNDVPASLTAIEQIWNRVNPDAPWDPHFLDRTIDSKYRSEMNVRTVFACFTLFAVFVSCLGLLGLSLFLVDQKTKEIGVRKVLGASVPSIVFMLTKSFARWVLLAAAIASPIASAVMNAWLQDFAYRISLNWWTFALAGGGALVIALLTVSIQSLRAATADPVEALRYE